MRQPIDKSHRIDAPAGVSARVDRAQSPVLADRNRFLEQQNRQLKLTVRRLSRLVFVDGLTGLANRRYFEMALDTEIRRASRARTPLTVVICDVDHFKQYNDTFGHQCGDVVLVKLSEAIRRFCRRAGDVAARYGGEEFALLFPGVGSWETIAVAQRLRRSVAALEIQHGACAKLKHITISVGVTTFRSASPCSASDVVQAADRALYRAKEAGRNRAKYQAIALA
jgi:diguanylate cyclase (GGDEF)-like protein